MFVFYITKKLNKIQNYLTLNLLTTTIVAPPSNASKWQMGFNSAFKWLKTSNIKLFGKLLTVFVFLDHKNVDKQQWRNSGRLTFGPEL